jgi:hypothetical protein
MNKPFIALYTERPAGDAALFLVFANRDAQTLDDVEGTKVNLEGQGEGVHIREFDFLREIPDIWDLKTEAAAIEAAAQRAEEDRIADTRITIQIPPETIAAIHRCLRILAGTCDHARRIDGAGFNKMDAEFGHSLADAHALSPKQAVHGQKLIRKYHRQLPADLLQVALGTTSLDVSEPSEPANNIVTHAVELLTGEVECVRTPAQLVNHKYTKLVKPGVYEPKSGDEVAGNGCEEPYGDTYQNGVAPGPKKLAQFREILELTGTPKLYAQEDKGDEALVHVKLFDPCGSWTWYITEFDPAENTAFGLVNGHEVECGYIDLNELATISGRMGIGIEIDMSFRPQTLAACREAITA